ncbi:MAG: hypothetical protein U0133_22160 [Gemmatimonadales bacterium]
MKFMLVVAIIAGVCWYYFKPLPPGKGPEAQHAMRVGSMVVQAAENYRSARRSLPLNLAEMVPEFLTAIPHIKMGGVSYERLGANYKVTVSYSDPIPKHCSMMMGTRWTCEWF